jgi:signal transduction histidine kinase
MRKFFRQLSLPKKLILIGVIPLVFLSYIAFELYQEKSQKLELLQLYTQRIYQSETLAKLIDALQNERKISFDHSINKEFGKGLERQRKQSDSLISHLKKEGDRSLERFEEYTFLDELGGIRKSIDENKASSGQIMDIYTNIIFRLNTLNSSFPSTYVYLRPVASDLSALRLLTEMQTYLGIIRSNIFNVLHSKAYIVETLIGTYGVHKVFHSYEKEFSIKAPPDISRMYEETRANSKLKPTLDYIDTVFKRFNIDTTYDADAWWKVSDEGINSLRSLQEKIWQDTKEKIDTVLSKERKTRNGTLIFLVLALVAVIAIVSYTIHIISSMLNELKHAAGKIAEGDPDVQVDIHSADALGALAESVRKMEKQVRERTTALQQANVKLGNSNKELEQFAYVASHDLQEPVRKIRTFTDQLMNGNDNNLDEKGRRLLDKIAASADRMKLMINDVLDYSQLERNEEEIRKVDLNDTLSGVLTDLELAVSQKNAVIGSDKLPVIDAIPVQLSQLFYNLLGNALKFSKQDVPPVINISISQPSDEDMRRLAVPIKPGQYFVLSFSDNGIGFNQEYAEKIFEMFQRLTAERTGTGIGLALCKKIVENHKGFIEAQSQAGAGTTFRIVLPYRQS